MGLVLQHNYLFSGTIMENIRYPVPHVTDEEVFAAAKALDVAGVLSERIVVPGALEIPAAIALAAEHYAGFIALGCQFIT